MPLFDPIGDGNCGTRCIARAITGDSELHFVVREAICDCFASLKDYYVGCWFQEEHEFDERIKNMRKSGTWIDHYELNVAIACAVYNVNIRVLEINAKNDGFDIKFDLTSNWEEQILTEEIKRALATLPMITLIRVGTHLAHYMLVDHAMVQSHAKSQLDVLALLRTQLEWGKIQFECREIANGRSNSNSNSNDVIMQSKASNESNLNRNDLNSNEKKSNLSNLNDSDSNLSINNSNLFANESINISDGRDKNEEKQSLADIVSSNSFQNSLNLPSLTGHNAFRSEIIYSIGPKPSARGLPRPDKLGYRVFGRIGKVTRISFFIEFKLYILARLKLKSPSMTRADLIREEFTEVYCKPGENLPVSKVGILNSQINRWEGNKPAAKLNYAARPDAIRIGGGGDKSDIDKDTWLAILEEYYRLLMDKKILLGTIGLKHIIFMILKERGDYFPTFIDEERSLPRYIYVSDYRVRYFRKMYNIKPVAQGKTFYDPFQVRKNQIIEFIKIGLAFELLPIVFVFCFLFCFCLCFVCRLTFSVAWKTFPRRNTKQTCFLCVVLN